MSEIKLFVVGSFVQLEGCISYYLLLPTSYNSRVAKTELGEDEGRLATDIGVLRWKHFDFYEVETFRFL